MDQPGANASFDAFGNHPPHHWRFLVLPTVPQRAGAIREGNLHIGASRQAGGYLVISRPHPLGSKQWPSRTVVFLPHNHMVRETPQSFLEHRRLGGNPLSGPLR